MRIQHVETERTVFSQAFGLATVRVHTAAGSTTIPALGEAEAASIRDRIAGLARVPDELSPRRLHPAEVVFAIGDALRELLVPLVVGVVLGSGAGSGRGLLLAAAFAGAGVVMAVARWRATTYALTGDALTFRSGLLSPDETVVPRARIGSVDLVQGPVQRLLGVVELQVHVAGGGDDPEIRLRADRPGGGARPAGRARAPRPAARAPGLPPVAPAGWSSPPSPARSSACSSRSSGRPGRSSSPCSRTARASAWRGARPTHRARSPWRPRPCWPWRRRWRSPGGVVAFAGFEVRVDGDRLRIRRGLLQRRAASLPLDRVHAVRLLESPLRQPFGLVSVRLETAGYRGQGAATRTLVPLASRREAGRLLDDLVPALGAGGDPVADLRRPPRRAAPALRPAQRRGRRGPRGRPRARRRRAPGRRRLVLLAAAAGLGLLRFRDAGWRLDGRRITVRERRLGRSTLVARRARLQRHATSASPLQRRAGLAAFELAVGSGAEGRVDQVDAADAARLYAELRPARAAAASPGSAPATTGPRDPPAGPP